MDERIRRAQAALASLAAIHNLEPVPDWYDNETGPDGFPIGMPEEEKLRDLEVEVSERVTAAADAPDPAHREFELAQADRCRGERRQLLAGRVARRTSATGHSGRAPRAATNARHRGSRRTSSPTRAGPDDDPGEPEPPRLCQLPGCDKPARRKYCTDEHAGLHRQWRKREREHAEQPVAPEITADYKRMVTMTAEDRELLNLLSVCRCNGHHIPELDPDLGEMCAKCGRALPGKDRERQELFRRFHASPPWPLERKAAA